MNRDEDPAQIGRFIFKQVAEGFRPPKWTSAERSKTDNNRLKQHRAAWEAAAGHGPAPLLQPPIFTPCGQTSHTLRQKFERAVTAASRGTF